MNGGIMMKRSLMVCCIFYLGSVCQAADQLPEKFWGDWSHTQVEWASNPYWRYHMNYPVELTIDRDGIFFKDIMSRECEPDVRFYERGLDVLMFDHCLPSKYASVMHNVYFRISVDGEVLIGEAWRAYGPLFRWKGKRVDGSAKQKGR